MTYDMEEEQLLASIKEHIDAIHNIELNKNIFVSMVGTLGVIVIKIIFSVYYLILRIDPRFSKEERTYIIKICKNLYKYS